ncbi:MAG: class C sortase [Clostridiales bacterium]|nr:class C sortase [Clostridiales bacterium]
MKKLYPMGVIFLIFVIGIGFILYPSIGNYVTLNTASVTIADYEEQVADETLEPAVDERLELAQQFNLHLFYGTNAEDEDKCLNVNDGVICYLDIPSISVYLPVYYGTSDEVLQKGCGYIENTSLPVGGENTNSGISGHTGLPGAELLSDLDQMEIGDLFYIHVLGDILAYEVVDVEVVEPDDASLLEIDPGRDLVTLVTCTPYGINSHRLLVRGERTEYIPQEDDEETISPQTVSKGLTAAMRRQLMVIAMIVTAALVAVLTAYLYHRRMKRLYPTEEEGTASAGMNRAEADRAGAARAEAGRAGTDRAEADKAETDKKESDGTESGRIKSDE